jgi:hypothetical protein
MAFSTATPRQHQRYPPDISERPALSSNPPLLISAKLGDDRRAPIASMMPPPYVFPRAALPTTPIRDNTSPFVAHAVTNTATSSALVATSQPPLASWLSSAISDDEEDEDEYEPDDGSVDGRDAAAEAEVQIDGNEVRILDSCKILLLIFLPDGS